MGMDWGAGPPATITQVSGSGESRIFVAGSNVHSGLGVAGRPGGGACVGSGRWPEAAGPHLWVLLRACYYPAMAGTPLKGPPGTLRPPEHLWLTDLPGARGGMVCNIISRPTVNDSGGRMPAPPGPLLAAFITAGAGTRRRPAVLDALWPDWETEAQRGSFGPWLRAQLQASDFQRQPRCLAQGRQPRCLPCDRISVLSAWAPSQVLCSASPAGRGWRRWPCSLRPLLGPGPAPCGGGGRRGSQLCWLAEI